jgi:DNA (cytosine-5)-methyltransferase 1
MRSQKYRRNDRGDVNYEIKRDPTWLVREEQKIYNARGEGILARKRKRFRLIDVFAGAGGMTLGFSKAFGHAFDSVWANDVDATCARTHGTNFGDHATCGDIVENSQRSSD